MGKYKMQKHLTKKKLMSGKLKKIGHLGEFRTNS